MKNLFLKLCLVASFAYPAKFAFANQDLTKLNSAKSDNLLTVRNKVLVNFYSDNNQKTNQANNYKGSNLNFNLYSNAKLSEKLVLNSYLKYQTIFDDYKAESRNIFATLGRDQNSQNNYLRIKELNFIYNFDKLDLKAGKFTANFGKAWSFNEGIWLKDMAGNYLYDEKIGAEIKTKLGNQQKVGEYNFSFAVFTNNGKNLDNSADVNRDVNYKYNANRSNKNSLSSYLASLDILFDFAKREKLSYHFSYINLAPSEKFSATDSSKIHNQKAFSLGLNYQYPLYEKLDLNALLEYVKVSNVGGNKNVKDNYLIANLVGNIDKNYNIALGYGRHKNNILTKIKGFRQDFVEISTGYKFNQTRFYDSLQIQVGYKQIRSNYKTDLDKWYGYGMKLTYVKNL
jgi:hypothetical protein